MANSEASRGACTCETTHTHTRTHALIVPLRGSNTFSLYGFPRSSPNAASIAATPSSGSSAGVMSANSSSSPVNRCCARRRSPNVRDTAQHLSTCTTTARPSDTRTHYPGDGSRSHLREGCLRDVVRPYCGRNEATGEVERRQGIVQKPGHHQLTLGCVVESTATDLDMATPRSQVRQQPRRRTPPTSAHTPTAPSTSLKVFQSNLIAGLTWR